MLLYKVEYFLFSREEWECGEPPVLYVDQSHENPQLKAAEEGQEQEIKIKVLYLK